MEGCLMSQINLNLFFFLSDFHEPNSNKHLLWILLVFPEVFHDPHDPSCNCKNTSQVSAMLLEESQPNEVNMFKACFVRVLLRLAVAKENNLSSIWKTDEEKSAGEPLSFTKHFHSSPAGSVSKINCVLATEAADSDPDWNEDMSTTDTTIMDHSVSCVLDCWTFHEYHTHWDNNNNTKHDFLLQPLPPLLKKPVCMTRESFAQVWIIAWKQTYESRCGNWNAKWHTCTFVHLHLCIINWGVYLNMDIVGTAPMHEHVHSLFSWSFVFVRYVEFRQKLKQKCSVQCFMIIWNKLLMRFAPYLPYTPSGSYRHPMKSTA